MTKIIKKHLQFRKIVRGACDENYFSKIGLNVNYIILFKIPKNQLSQIYIDQPININKELFYKIVSELNKYENIIIDLKTHMEKFQIRKNLNEILC